MNRSLIILVFLFLPFLSLAISDSIQVYQSVTDTCNNDGNCSGQETYANCPNDCRASAPIPGTGGTGTLPSITYLDVQPMYDSAIIIFETNRPTKADLYWGKTAEYEMGSISEIDFSQEHKVILSDLESDTDYHFKINLMDRNFRRISTYDQQFKTLAERDEEPPANVSNLTVLVFEEEDALLEWDNPPDPDFAGVRIVKSEKFFPQSVFEGETVFEDKANSFLDEEIEEGVRYYYTVFSYDASGNYSSGAIAMFAIFKPIVPGIPEIPIIPEIPEVPIEEVPPDIQKIGLGHFEFFQKGVRLPFVDGKIEIDGLEPLEIFLNYEKLPEVLKTILITLTEPEKKTFSFLLKINKEKTRYEAKIAPLKVGGLYEVSIAILDYKNRALKKLKTFFFVEGQLAAVDKGLFKTPFNYLLIIALIIILLLVLLSKKREKEDVGTKS